MDFLTFLTIVLKLIVFWIIIELNTKAFAIHFYDQLNTNPVDKSGDNGAKVLIHVPPLNVIQAKSDRR